MPSFSHPPAPPHLVCHPTLQKPDAATRWPVAPFPPPLAGPVPTASQPHTAPCLSAGPSRPFSSEIWNPVSKAKMLKPFDQPALEWPSMPSKTVPPLPISLPCPACWQPLLQPDLTSLPTLTRAIPALPVTQETLQEIPLPHSTEAPAPCPPPQLSRLLALLCVTSLCPPLAPEGSCRHLDCPAGCWAQRRFQQGGQISQLGGREERRDPGITDLELRVACAPHGSLGALGRGELQPQAFEV